MPQKKQAATPAERQAKSKRKQRGELEPDPEKAASMLAAFLEKNREAVAKTPARLKTNEMRGLEKVEKQLLKKSKENMSLKKQVQLAKNDESSAAATIDGSKECEQLSTSQRLQMRKWLVEIMKLQEEVVKDFNDKDLQLKYTMYKCSLEGIVDHRG